MIPSEKHIEERQVLDVPSIKSVEKKLVIEPNGPPSRKPNISSVPTSDLFHRLENFLPSLHQANRHLVGQENVTIEEGEDTLFGKPCIELDLACGVFELKDEIAVQAAEKAMVDRTSNIAPEIDSDPGDTPAARHPGIEEL